MTSAGADDDESAPCPRPGSGSSPSSGRGPRATCPSSGSARSRSACPSTVAPGVFIAGLIEPLEVLHFTDSRPSLHPQLPSTSLNQPLPPLLDLLGRYTRPRGARGSPPLPMCTGPLDHCSVINAQNSRSRTPYEVTRAICTTRVDLLDIDFKHQQVGLARWGAHFVVAKSVVMKCLFD